MNDMVPALKSSEEDRLSKPSLGMDARALRTVRSRQ